MSSHRHESRRAFLGITTAILWCFRLGKILRNNNKPCYVHYHPNQFGRTSQMWSWLLVSHAKYIPRLLFYLDKCPSLITHTLCMTSHTNSRIFHPRGVIYLYLYNFIANCPNCRSSSKWEYSANLRHQFLKMKTREIMVWTFWEFCSSYLPSSGLSWKLQQANRILAIWILLNHKKHWPSHLSTLSNCREVHYSDVDWNSIMFTTHTNDTYTHTWIVIQLLVPVEHWN